MPPVPFLESSEGASRSLAFHLGPDVASAHSRRRPKSCPKSPPEATGIFLPGATPVAHTQKLRLFGGQKFALEAQTVESIGLHAHSPLGDAQYVSDLVIAYVHAKQECGEHP